MRIAAPSRQDCPPHVHLALSDIPNGRKFGRDSDSINDPCASEDINITSIRQNFGRPLFPTLDASVAAKLQRGKGELATLELEPENRIPWDVASLINLWLLGKNSEVAEDELLIRA